MAKKELTHTEKIQKWIEQPTPDHAEGINLLSPLTKNKHLISKLTKENSWSKSKVRYLLEQSTAKAEAKDAADKNQAANNARKANEAAAASKAKAEEQLKDAVLEVVNGRKLSAEEFDKAPQDVKDLEGEWKDKYAQRAYLQANIEKVQDEELRKEQAGNIIALTEDIDDAWARIAYYKEHRTLPEAKTLTPTGNDELLELTAKQKTLRDRVSRLKKKQKEGDATEADIKAIETDSAEVKAISEKIKALKATK